MKNIPRIYIDCEIASGAIVSASREIAHYLRRVMRSDTCLVFNKGVEFNASLSSDDKHLIIGTPTSHVDPSNDITLMFAPVKRTDDLLNMATQMGVRAFLPVITQRTNANHINWERMKKIVIESSEQSNRNSVPEILMPKKFEDLDLSKIAFADERAAYGHDTKICNGEIKTVLVGPEGGFSESEFEKLDSAGACGISLGKTILRAELAAAIAISKLVG
jgi:16S rRNA (uracil1498-N3)-methyltransferase